MIASPATVPPASLSVKQGLFRIGAKRQRGQALVFSLFAAVLMVLALYAMYGMGSMTVEKIKLQNTADAAAYSAAVAEARDYNFSAYTNRAMVANQVAVAQFVGLTSWFRNMSSFANDNSGNWGRKIYQLFFDVLPSPLGRLYMRFLNLFGKAMGLFDEGRGGASFMSLAVTVLDGLNLAYTESQRIYHYGTVLTVVQTLGGFSAIAAKLDEMIGVDDWFGNLAPPGGWLDGDSVIYKNDKNARLSTAGIPYFVYHIYEWLNFTERKDPNNAPVAKAPGVKRNPGDGDESDRFAQVALDSLDDFSRDRSTKPAWGFNMFYAPPLTYIDPTRFAPMQSGPLFLPVIHRGGTELKLTDNSGSGSGTGGGNTTTPLDCHGNPIDTSGSASSISAEQYSGLPTGASICEGTPGSVTVGDAAHPKGPYAYGRSKSNPTGPMQWINPNDLRQDPNDPANGLGGRTGGQRATGSGSGNNGAAGTRAKKAWTAMDASSWAGLDILWVMILVVPVPLPLPFMPPWLPVSSGGAQSGMQMRAPTVLAADNNFGVSASEAYGGTMSSWMTSLSGNLQKGRGAHTTLTKGGGTASKPGMLGGLTSYMDVKDLTAENLVAPPLVIEVEKPIDKIASPRGTGRLSLENGAPEEVLSDKQYLRALSKAEVYFGRPTSDAALDWFKRTVGSPNQVELGSLYNPYWQPRLAANSFIEQYLSMELHRLGL